MRRPAAGRTVTAVRFLLLLAAAAAILGSPTASALANPPDGDWTSVRKDAFKHYACKKKAKNGFTVKTATFLNGDDKAVELEIGAYTALARSSNKRLIDERTSTAWREGYIRTTLRGADASDRLWMQGAYYGPAAPWSDGFPVRRLTRCD
jgi:hypothetical protein